jgi:hypothetical protein
MLVFSDAVSEDVEDEYNAWYSNRHLQDLIRMPRVVAATRYRIAKGIEATPGMPTAEHGYLAIYELDADSPAGIQEFVDALAVAIERGEVKVSPALDAANVSATFAIAIGDRLVPSS